MECDCIMCDGAAFFDTGSAVQSGLGLGLGFLFAPQMFAMLNAPKKTCKTVIVCINCGEKNAEDFKFCGHCGRPLYPTPRVQCPKCDTPVPDMKFCESCGNKLKK